MHNRRIGKTVDTDGDGDFDSRERYVWDIAAMDGKGNVVLDFVDDDLDGTAEGDELSRRYLWGQAVDQVFAQENVDLLSSGAEDVAWLLTDNLGTVRDVVTYDDANDTTAVDEHLTYAAFGKITSGDATVTRYTYTAQELDTDTGLYYMDNRWYDPATGKFMSQDPVEDDKTNGDRYVGNSPTNATDPSGLSAIGKVFRTAIMEGSEATIKNKVKREIRDNWYEYIAKHISKEELSASYQVHHIIVQRLFKEPQFGKFFDDIGILRDASKNTTVLPTKRAAQSGADIGTASLHQGRHIKNYDELIEGPLRETMEQFNKKAISKDQAYEQVAKLQAQTRKGLQDGTIKLHHYDTPTNRQEWLKNGAISIFALALFSGATEAEAEEIALDNVGRMVENETYYRQKNVIVRYGTAGYYVKDSNSSLARWLAFGADFFNPVEDVIFVTDIVEDAAKLGIAKLIEAEETSGMLAEEMGRAARNMQDPNSSVRSRKRILGQLQPSTRPKETAPPSKEKSSSSSWWWPF